MTELAKEEGWQRKVDSGHYVYSIPSDDDDDDDSDADDDDDQWW